ncbi:MAG: DNA alkylation repair protein [Clostridiales bacterium]|jgi:3-methyladenine DNA glycosylase AlkD|nr:DNA alkylation repair protein [Clostridiales bacterium]
MNFQCSWNEQKYKEFIDHIKTLRDLKYKEFASKITNDKNLEFIGIRTPILRDIAKQISKNNYLEFLKINKYKYFEECMIHAFIIEYLKPNFEELIKMLKNFVPHISNWALCDTAAKKYPQLIKNQDITFNEIIKFTRFNNPWEVRFGLILILNNFVNEKFIDKILEICKDIKLEYYYVRMGNAWLISNCYAKFPKNTKKLLKLKILDKWTQNKSIQKILDSNKINKENKLEIKKLKIN